MLGVVLVDRHQLYRQGVADVVLGHSSLRLVGQHSSWDEAVEDICLPECDLVIGDPDFASDGIGPAIEKCLSLHEGLRLVILSHCAVDECVLDCLKRGAAAFLTKDIGRSELLVALDAVIAGNVVIASQVAPGLRLAIGKYGTYATDSKMNKGPETSYQVALSRRELEVLAMVGAGACNKEVAVALGISEHTVKAHIRSIMGKTNIHDREALAAFDRGSRITSIWNGCSAGPYIKSPRA